LEAIASNKFDCARHLELVAFQLFTCCCLTKSSPLLFLASRSFSSLNHLFLIQRRINTSPGKMFYCQIHKAGIEICWPNLPSHGDAPQQNESELKGLPEGK
jgi:hypothetical protein